MGEMHLPVAWRSCSYFLGLLSSDGLVSGSDGGGGTGLPLLDLSCLCWGGLDGCSPIPLEPAHIDGEDVPGMFEIVTEEFDFAGIW